MKRYILLRYNEIIDTEKNPIVQEKYLDGFIYRKEKDKDNIFSYVFKPSSIIKESDELIDLIEVGDLLEVKIVGYKKTIKQELVDKDVIFVLGDGMFLTKVILEDTLLKIWKPNGNRGYDLVWEREEE